MAVERNRLDAEFRGEFCNRGVAALHGGLQQAGLRLLTLVAEQRGLAVARNSPHLSAQAVTAVAAPQTPLMRRRRRYAAAAGLGSAYRTHRAGQIPRFGTVVEIRAPQQRIRPSREHQLRCQLACYCGTCLPPAERQHARRHVGLAPRECIGLGTSRLVEVVLNALMPGPASNREN